MSTAVLEAPSTTTSAAKADHELPLYRLSVEQYHAMIRNGILGDQPVELLDGFLVLKMAKNPPHCFSTDALMDLLRATIPTGWYVRSEKPITLSESEPEPDLAVARGQKQDYIIRHPSPNDLALVIEVADSSLRRDRNLKQVLYSESCVAQYWIVDVDNHAIEVFTVPSGVKHKGYGQSRVYTPDDRVPVILDGVTVGEILVRDVLPA